MSGATFWIVLFGTNIGCACLGFLLGRLTRAAVEVEQHMIDDTEESPPKRRRRSPTAMQLVALAVVAIGLITAVVGYNVTRNQDRLAGCVVGYSNATSDALQASRAAQREVNEQLDGFMRAVLTAFTSTPAEGRQLVFTAVEQFVKAREEQIKVQRENPLPEPPRDACAELLD